MSGRRSPRVVLLTGGFGGGRLAPALAAELGASSLTVVANSGDDFTWHGLRVWPDFDTVLYALAGCWDSERGWGRRHESFRAVETLQELGAEAWLRVGDTDLALNLLRTELLATGATPDEVAHDLSTRLGVGDVELVPAASAPAETHVVTGEGERLHFQEWFVREGAVPELAAVQLGGGSPTEGCVRALRAADAVILGPSNPVASIGAILALDGVEAAVREVPTRVGVSPVVLRRPPITPGLVRRAEARRKLLRVRGWSHTPRGVTGAYAGLIDWFVLDRADASDAEYVTWARTETTDTLDPTGLARLLREIVARGPGRERDLRPSREHVPRHRVQS